MNFLESIEPLKKHIRYFFKSYNFDLLEKKIFFITLKGYLKIKELYPKIN